MTAAGPWSVKGIDPKAREIAKDLARRSGMTLGDWLNQMIIDGGELEAGEPAAPAPSEPRRPLDELYREARRASGATPLRPAEAEPARMARALETLATRVEAAEHRSVLAISGMDQSVMGVLSRLDEIERESGGGAARLEGSVEDIRAAQAKISDRLRRLEGADAPRAESLKALEAALGRMAMRMDEEALKAAEARAELQAAADAAAETAREAADAARSATESVGRRLEKMETVVEAAPAAYADAEKVETVLTRMAERLDQTETRTTAAVQSLQTSFAGLDARLRANEARGHGHNSSADIERRFQALAQELSQRVEASRTEIAQRLRAAADGRFDKMETALHDLGGHVDQAEKRSAQAIDRIGREVMRVAHSLGERVGVAETRVADLAGQAGERLDAVESRSTAAVETMGAEVSRLADAMESRLRHADGAQAEALEKLGGEIARIAERLAERISTSERRSADAIDEVTDRVAKLGARIDEGHAASVSELAERIKASETRTAKLLDDARERLDQRLTDGRRTPETLAIEPAPPTPSAIDHPSAPAPTSFRAEDPEPVETNDLRPLSNADPFASLPSLGATEVATQAAASGATGLDDDPFAGRNPFLAGETPFNPDDDFSITPWAGPEPVMAEVGTEAGAETVFTPMFGGAAHEPDTATTSSSAESPPFLGFSVGDFAPAPASALRPEQASTREMLEAARQAARRAAGGGRSEPSPLGSVPAPPLEPVSQATRPFGITFPGRRKKESAPTLRTLILASATAGAITTMGVGAYLLGGASHDGAKMSPEVAAMGPPPTAAPLGAPGLAGGGGSTIPTLAIATAPALAPAAKSRLQDAQLATTRNGEAPLKAPKAKPDKAQSASETATALVTPAPGSSAKALFASAVSRIDSGDAAGVADLQKAADKGDPAAQFYLARLYEAGGAGLKKDVAQARTWTAKAAQNGDPAAMYNLASYMYAGDGGAKDLSGAATWFRRSAERGVVNGQYNLAQLYEKGYGVPQSNAEAYKWYLVAAAAGDTEAKSAADALKTRIAADAQAAAERNVAKLRAQMSGGVETAAASQP